MVILVDLDDVMEDLVPAYVEYNNKKYGLNINVEDIKEWDMSAACPTLTKDEFYWAEHNDDALWDLVKPMPGAVETLKKLQDEGHEIYVCTATYYETLRAKFDKVLFKYFPFIDIHHVIVTFKKQMLIGDVLIDDGPHNLIGPTAYKKILFDRKHNQNLDESTLGAVRAYNWEDIYRILQKMNNE